MVKYFAYGSNMSPARMASRECNVFAARKAYLHNFDIAFNKRSKSLFNTGFANLKQSPGSVVEGILYETDDNSLAKLDRFEGYPHHYQRVQMMVVTEKGEEIAEVYVAKSEWITEGLRPSKEYLAHLLDAKDVLSETYFNRLKCILTTDI